MNARKKNIAPKSVMVALAFVVIFCSVILSKVIEYEPSQIKAVGLLISALILWISNALPMSISTLLLMFSLPLLGLMEYNDVLNNFGIGTALFIMASSGITVAIIKSNIPYKITEKIFKKFGERPAVLVFCLGLAVTVFSGFVSSLATCTLFTTLISSAFNSINIPKEKNSLAKALMLSVPVCAGIGGFISPAGTPANLLVMDWLKENGINITFAKWCAIGFPVSLISSIVFLTLLVLVFKPKKINYKNAFISKTMDKNDYSVLTIVGIVIIGWFLSSFVNFLNIALVAIVGLVLLMLPCNRIITYEQFGEGVNWDLVFTMGSVSVLMTAIANTGIITRIASAIAGILPTSNLFVLLFGLSVIICVIRAFVPTTTAVIALLLPMLVDISKIANVNCNVLLLITAYWAAAALLLVFTEPIFLISYKEGYFKQADLFKVGILTNIILASVCPILIYYIYLSF
jgi:sodium-dependent dicarboxylate transporter 2/3/5